MAEVLYELKRETEEGDTIQIKILKVKKDGKYPQGVKYRLAFIHGEKRVLGYDNLYPEGHHRHIIKSGKELKASCNFVDVATLLGNFKKDVNRWRDDNYGSNRKK